MATFTLPLGTRAREEELVDSRRGRSPLPAARPGSGARRLDVTENGLVESAHGLAR